MTEIVTGASGFIGGHLVDALASRGEEVRCLVRRPLPAASSPTARVYRTDFAQADLGLPDEAFDRVDTVYHLAGATRAASEPAFHAANVTATERLMDRVLRAGVLPRFVYVSSQAAAGPAPDEAHPLSERDAEAPIEAYGRSKLAAERAVLARRRELPVTVIRPVAVYGPGDRDFLSIFRLLKRGFAVYPGIRDSLVNTIFVADLVGGIVAAARSSAAMGKTYFMGHGKPATWRAIYREVARVLHRERFLEINIPLAAVRLGGMGGDLVARVTGRTPLINGSKAALAGPTFWTCSSERAAKDFGFAAPTSLSAGLRQTHDWYLEHGLM
jgi:nucleoside-diphosphate-sugar epimerase